ncbi:hypothetical protein [Nonomuraea basaltis]|uniref:hypothetical protein n=1 Tax=Nonomuraea basaltis TaxID=2495887 RepID=UPI00110C44B3|nr:hypothetical protein [Nonomuraea basaltis]TMR88631.1 hypothetical protein EJK15_65180 [Nonomuraea basaltis]
MIKGETLDVRDRSGVTVDEGTACRHGWDLARATGQPFTCNPANTAAVLAFTSASALPDQAANREGLFGPVVEVSEDAPELDRALGFAGRDPAWTPKPA